MAKKMSPAREGLLRELVKEPRTLSQTYPPLLWLLQQGHAAVSHQGKWGSTTYKATEAGRRALQEIDGQRHVA